MQTWASRSSAHELPLCGMQIAGAREQEENNHSINQFPNNNPHDDDVSSHRISEQSIKVQKKKRAIHQT